MPRLSKIGAAALAAFGWTSGSAVTASYLVVAGGGGGANFGGGGGAGGFRTGASISLNPSLSYTVTVGAGGSGNSPYGTNGVNGSDSVFSTITSTGGGGGGSNTNNGSNGGSGGGGSRTGTGGASSPVTSPVQGYAGGAGATNGATYFNAGGGGGSSAAGSNAIAVTGNTQGGGTGGAGTASSISGSSATYAGGGGGGAFGANGGPGGSGGAGSGGGDYNTATSATSNTGSGGGGGGNGVKGGNGGSGIVIISYVGAQQFSGGVVTSSGGNTIHTFTTSGTLGPITPLTANFLVVAGGGGGGSGGPASDAAGGGGAGGFRTSAGTSGGGASAESALTIDPNSIYLVTVGAGGTGGVGTDIAGTAGGSSTFLNVTSVGGGRGGVLSSTTGQDGGSGGGGGTGGSAGVGAGAGTANQGYAGGGSGTYPNGSGGGGGGAGAVGTAGGNSSGSGGNGGNGVASSISGSSVTYAGGGGGGGGGSNGGTGGGGAGNTAGTAGTAGTTNLGAGGGGAKSSGASPSGGNGGSGIVIISYAGSTQQMAGGTVTISSGNVIHTFTSSGYLTPIKYVGNSLRFRASASAYLSRTPAVDGSRTTWTWSSWVKRGTLGTGQTIFGRDQNGSGQAFAQLNFNSSDQLNFINYSTTTDNVKTSNAVYRDPAAWYHIVCVFNSGNATASDRIQLYVNGQRITSFSSSTDPSLNYSGYINQAGLQHDIGSILVSSRINYVDGYLTEINFIDGQALTPNSFGTVNAYGVWQPITYGGSYGTNGFYLPFTNTTSTTTLGYDFSPNGNNWTTNNISLTAGVTYDSMTDVPTLTSATASNFCVVSPFQLSASGALFTLSYGNLNYSCGASAGNAGRMLAVGTMALPTGKTYWEIKATNTNGLPGISDGAYAADNASGPYKYIGVYNAGQSLNNTTATYTGTTFTYTTNDMIGFAFDGTAMTLACYKNGSLIGTFSAIDSTVTWLPFVGVATGSSSTSCEFNFGQRPFSYTPPSGFVALNTYNL